MLRVAAVPLVVLAFQPFHSSIKPVSAPVRAEVKRAGAWHRGCPVGFSNLRILTVTHWGFDGRRHTGRLVTNRSAAAPLAKVFHQLYRLHFPVHHMQLDDVYGPKGSQSADPSGSFECRQAVPSPCTGGSGTGHWSMHAYGLAVDLNPVENPYVGCGQSRDPAARPYRDRSHHRKGMVTPRVVQAFRSIGWGWGGSWAGNTKDYMHFSATGH
ncbi:MAG: M15 family metallopeptidase [Thermoleophilaceae bacterium]